MSKEADARIIIDRLLREAGWDIAVKASELGRLQAETAALLDSFTPALLAKAFRGEL